MTKTLLVAGATGLVGSEVLRIALRDPGISTVIAPLRRALPEAPGLEQWIASDVMDGMQDRPVDAVICCLGTTMKQVGGDKQKFIHVDKELVVALGEWGVRNGVQRMCVISAMGAESTSRIFYNRVKGEMEDGLKKLELPSLHLFHPSILTGPRGEKRLGERIGIVALQAFAPLMVGPLRPYRPMPNDVLASALVHTALHGEKGVHTHTFDAIHRMARSNDGPQNTTR